jgi:hypothetical protein
MKTVYQGFAAGSLGLLVGLLAGLALSPVVASLLGIVAAAAIVLLGLKPTAQAGAAAILPDQAMLARVGAFAILCAAGVLSGLYLRSHDALTPSIRDQLRQWTDAGFSPDEARAIVRFRNAGMPAEGGKAAATPQAGAAAALPTGLYAGTTSDDCPRLEPSRYKNAAEVLNAYRLEKGRWEKAAEQVEKHVPREEERLAVLEFLWRLACEP